jgi:dolichol-phosphate mannosyltransferase
MSTPYLTVVVPVFNETPQLKENLERVCAFLSTHFPSHEVIVVDDGSTDGSRAVAEELVVVNPRLKVVGFDRNRGKGCAVRAGAREASGQWVAIVDADLELPIEMLPSFFEVQRSTGAMIVIGSKRHEESRVVYPKARMALSNQYNRIVNLMFNLRLTDTQLGFKLINRSVLCDVLSPLLVKRYAFDLEFLVVETLRGVRVAEAPVRLNFNRPGSGRIGLRSAASVMIETAGVWYRRYVTRYYSRVIPPAALKVLVLPA